jgi:pimeloyl-ACP methyl ester carboxylesterase
MGEAVELILLPGLGADYRLFAPQAAAFESLTVPPWIPPDRGESLQQYAARLAESIEFDGPYVLGGVSLGGMIAYEMAAHLVAQGRGPRGLVLIATCRTRRGLRGWYRGLAPAAACLPTAALSASKPIAPWAAKLYGRLPAEMRELTVRMFQDADSRFMQWALSAISHWQPSAAADVPTLQIHGRRDRVIPIRNVDPNRIVEDGGHLINLTHPQQVNKFIGGAIAKWQAGD